MKRRIVVVIAVLVCLASGAVAIKVFASRSDQPSVTPAERMQAIFSQPRPVAIETVGVANGSERVSYPGTVKACEKTELAFRVSGPLIAVNIKPGQIVEKGEVLMRIDPRDFKNRVETAQARLDASKARFQAMRKGARDEDRLALEAQLEGAQAQLKNAELDFERAETLFKQTVIPQADFDRAQSRLTVAHATVRNLTQQLKKARVGDRPEDIAAMEANIRELKTQLDIAENDLEDTYLRAPYAGVITYQHVENFEMVKASQPVLAMHDISELEIDVNVPESELTHGALNETRRATINFPAVADKAFEGHVKEWNTDADPLTRTYTITFAMKSPADVRILPGMTAEVSCCLQDDDTHAQQLVIPSSAIVADSQNNTTVWVFNPQTNTAQAQKVVIGPASDQNHVVVRNGLKAGESIVTAGAEFITAEMKLTPLRADQSLESKKTL